MMTIIIQANGNQWKAELESTETAEKILAALPIEGTANTWGEEIYFEIPVDADLEPEATADVEPGDIGYWPPGSAFCIFFGPTPLSTGDKPKAASPVNVFGRISGDLDGLKKISDGTPILVKAG